MKKSIKLKNRENVENAENIENAKNVEIDEISRFDNAIFCDENENENVET